MSATVGVILTLLTGWVLYKIYDQGVYDGVASVVKIVGFFALFGALAFGFIGGQWGWAMGIAVAGLVIWVVLIAMQTPPKVNPTPPQPEQPDIRYRYTEYLGAQDDPWAEHTKFRREQGKPSWQKQMDDHLRAEESKQLKPKTRRDEDRRGRQDEGHW